MPNQQCQSTDGWQYVPVLVVTNSLTTSYLQITWLKTVPDDLKLHNSATTEAIDVVQNQLLRILLAITGIMHS